MIALVRVCLGVFWVQSPAKRIASLAFSSFAVEGGWVASSAYKLFCFLFFTPKMRKDYRQNVCSSFFFFYLRTCIVPVSYGKDCNVSI